MAIFSQPKIEISGGNKTQEMEAKTWIGFENWSCFFLSTT